MAAQPLAQSQRSGDVSAASASALLSPTPAAAASATQPPASAAAAAAPVDDPFSMFSNEGAEAVAAAALRDFCAAPAERTAPGEQRQQHHAERSSGGSRRKKESSSSSASSSSSRHSKEGQQRHSSSSRHPSATHAARPAASSISSRSATPSSASSVDEGPGHEADSPSSARRSSSRSSRSRSGSRSPSPHRHQRRDRGEGQGLSPASAAAMIAALSPPASGGGADYSGSGSHDYHHYTDSHARVARDGRDSFDHQHQRNSYGGRSPPASSRKAPSSAAASNASSRYNTFGELDRSSLHHAAPGSGSSSALSLDQARAILASAPSLPAWLVSQGFDSSVQSRLQAVGCLSLPHALRLSKRGLKEILGVRDGLRCHLALREIEQARNVVEDATGEKWNGGGVGGEDSHGRTRSPPARRHGSSSRSKHDAGRRRSASPSTLFRELHPPGLHGYCAQSDCDLPAGVRCAVRSCHIGLCMHHSHKMLLTGTIVCEHCYAQASYVGNIKEATGITALEEQGYIQPIEQCAIQ